MWGGGREDNTLFSREKERVREEYTVQSNRKKLMASVKKVGYIVL